MENILVSRGIRSPIDLRAYVHDRLRFGLDRFQEVIRAVRVHLSDDNGPGRGGVDKLCRVMVTLRGGQVIVRQFSSENVLAAISETIDRIEQSISRRIKKLRGKIRRQQQP